MKNAIIFGPEGPDTSAEGVVTAKFAKMLSNNDINVYWICHSTPINYGSLNTDYSYNVISIKNTFIQWLITKFKNIPILNKITYLDIIVWCIKAYFIAQKINKVNHISYVFSRIMPQYGHLPALLFKRKNKITWIGNWSDPMPREKAPKPYGNGLDAPISRILNYYLNCICKYADIHTFPSDQLKNYYLNYLPAKETNCFVIPHIIDKDINIKNNEHKELRLYHIGGGLKERNPRLFFRSFRQILSDPNFADIILDIKFIGPVEGDVKNIAKEEGVLSNIKFTGKVPYEQALEYIKEADILLIIEAIMDHGIFLPSKLSDILAFHKPIYSISPNTGVMHDLITTYHGGIVADCQSLESISSQLRRLLEDWEQNKLTAPIYNTDKLRNLFSEKNIWHKLNEILSTNI